MQSLKDFIQEQEGIHGKSLLSRRSFNFLVGGDADNSTSSWREKLKQEECSICTKAISNKPFILLPCTHVFHAECFINYISRATNTGSRKCPNCKEDFMGKIPTRSGNYVGQHKNGVQDGFGKKTYSDGSYVGEFQNGKLHGKGTMKYENGDIFTESSRMGRDKMVLEKNIISWDLRRRL